MTLHGRPEDFVIPVSKAAHRIDVIDVEANLVKDKAQRVAYISNVILEELFQYEHAGESFNEKT